MSDKQEITLGPTLTEHFERGDIFAKPCPSRQILKDVCSRWGVLVFVALRNGGTLRFSELKRKMGGVSEKMLSQTLQTLADDGFVLRVSYPVVPPFVEYSLTPLGEEAAEKVVGLADWIESNILRVLNARSEAERKKEMIGAVQQR